MAEDKDPFAEFGGSLVANDKDPFAEFGGSKLRGKPLNTDLTSGTQTSKRGSNPSQIQDDTKFAIQDSVDKYRSNLDGYNLDGIKGGNNPSIISNSIPSVLTPKGQADYKEQIKNYKSKPIVAPKEEKPDFFESVKNSLSNVGTGVQQFIPNTAIALSETLQGLLGKDLGSDFYRNIVGSANNPELDRQEAYAKLAELEPQFKRTRGLIESAENFDAVGLAAATIDAMSSLVRTAITSVPTAGIGLASDMVGGSIASYNQEKAKSKGISVDELYNRGENEFAIPATIGVIGTGLEAIGLKGTIGLINKKLTGSFAKKFATTFVDVNKEGLTEFLQTGLDASNKALSQGKSVADASKVAVDEMFSKKGLESYLMGVVGSAGSAGVGRVVKGMLPTNKKKATEATQKIAEMESELSNPNISPATQEFIAENIRQNVAEVADAIENDANEVEGLSDDQKFTINSINEVIGSYEQVLADPNASEQTKKLAQERINGLDLEVDNILQGKKLSPEIQALVESKVPPLEKPTIDTEEQIIAEGKKSNKIAEIESILSNDDAVFAETGSRPLLSEARAELKAELEKLRQEQDASKNTTPNAVVGQPKSKEDAKKADYTKRIEKKIANASEEKNPVNKALILYDALNSATRVDTGQKESVQELLNAHLAESGLKIENVEIGTKYNETNTSLDATIAGVGFENLKVIEVLSPIIRDANGVIVKQGKVIVESSDNKQSPTQEAEIAQNKQSKPQENAVNQGNIEQGNITEREGITEQQQGQQAPKAEIVEKPKIVVNANLNDEGQILAGYRNIDRNAIETPIDQRDNIEIKNYGRTVVLDKDVNSLGDTDVHIGAPIKAGRGGIAQYEISIPKGSNATVDGLVEIIKNEHDKNGNPTKSDIEKTMDLLEDYLTKKVQPPTEETVGTIKLQQDATKTRKIDQSNIGEYSGVTEQQQGQQEDRQYQEEPISQAETETGDSGGVVESREVEEVTAPEITPNKSVKANQKIASQEIAKARKIRETDGEVLFTQFKDKRLYDAEVDDNAGEIPKDTFIDLDNVPPILKGVFKRLEDSGLIEEVDERYYLTDKGKDFNDAVQARLSTRKGVKAGTDMFPTEAGLSEAEVKKSDKPKVEEEVIKESTETAKEGFTEGKDLNRIFAESKKKYGEKEGAKYNDVVNRLVNPNKNTIIEVRSNGVVVKEGDKYLLKPFTNTDANYKKWELARPLDVTEQYVTPKSEPKESKGVQKEDALKDVESTTKALENIELPKNFVAQDKGGILNRENYYRLAQEKFQESKGLSTDEIFDKNKQKEQFKTEKGRLSFQKEFEQFSENNQTKKQIISEAYHKAKQDGTNPELVKAVEDLLGNKTNEKAKTEEVKRPIETPRVAERKGEVESAREEAKAAVHDLLDFVKKSRGNIGSFADVGTFSAKMALVFKAYAKLGIVKLKDVVAKLREDAGDEFVDENTDAIESSFNDFSGVPKAEPIKTSDDFTELAYKNIESDEFRNTLSNKERESGRELTPEEKRLAIQPLLDAFRLGTDIIEKAKDEFGDKYVQTLLDYIRDNEKSLGVDKVSLILISLENDLNKQMLDDPDNLTIKKQERMVQNIAIAYQRTVARALGYGKLRQIARVGYDIDRVTDEFFSTKQREGKRKILKAIESNMDDINTEAELQEQEVGDIIIEAPKVKRTAKEVKADISEVIKKMRADLVKAARGNVALSSVIPFESQIRTVTPHVIKLAKLYAELGGMKAKEIISEIRKEIKQVAPDVTEQDIRSILKGEQEGKANPKDRLEKAKERVKERVAELQQQITDKRKELKIRNVPETDTELASLIAQEKQLKEEANKYLTQESIDRINESKEKAIVTRLENELADLDEQIAKGEKERVEKKEPKSTPQIEALRAQRKAKIEILNELDPNPKEFTKQALIDAGYSREINVTLKDGTKEKRQVLDWKKLAGEEGSIDNIREVVENALKDKGFTDAQISRMRDAFVTEFNELRANIATKAIKELRRLNEPKEAPQRKSSARRLAELYDLGLFEQNSDEFDYLVNKAIGLSDVGQEAFFEAKRFAASLSELYKMSSNEFFTKQFIREINFKISKLLNKVAFQEGGTGFKFVTIVSELMNLMLRTKLQSLKQYLDNQISGRQERLIQDVGNLLYKDISTKELDDLRKKYASVVKEDIVKNAGLYFGEVNTPFLTKSQIEDYLNSLTKDRLYHHLLSVALGKSYLEGADSLNKAASTERFFTSMVLKAMTDSSNPNRVTREEALKILNEQLTGQKFSEALNESERIIKQINQSAGREILSETKENIFRGAMDLVKANLLVGQALDAKMIEASYNAAYKVAGYGLGHEANNLISEGVNRQQAFIEEKLKAAIKNKEWGDATGLTMIATINRNIINPFVGGGMNWLFLGLQKSGIDVASPLYYTIRKLRSGIDLSTPEGVNELQKQLVADYRLKTLSRRFLIGATAASLFTLGFIASGGEDELDKWLEKNKWAKKYLSVFIPQLTLLVMASRKGEFGDWVTETFSKSAKFEKLPKIVKGIEEYNKDSDPSRAKAFGVFGNVLGSSIDVPLAPVRFLRDLGGVYKYIVDKPQERQDFLNIGFANGFFNYGAIDYMGFRPDRTYMRNIEEYIPESDDKTIKFLRSKGLDINADSDQPIIYKGFSTYMSEEQAQKYDKKYGETVYGILKDKSESISDLSENDFKKVMKFIKNKAKDEALKTIGAVDNRASELTREGIKYILPPDLLKKRTDYIETYIRKNKSSIRSLARETAKYDKVDLDIAIMIEEQALRDEANTDSGDIIYEKYKDKLMVKE